MKNENSELFQYKLKLEKQIHFLKSKLENKNNDIEKLNLTLTESKTLLMEAQSSLSKNESVTDQWTSMSEDLY